MSKFIEVLPKGKKETMVINTKYIVCVKVGYNGEATIEFKTDELLQLEMLYKDFKGLLL